MLPLYGTTNFKLQYLQTIVAQILEFVYGRIQNVMRKGENAGYLYLFQKIISEVLSPRVMPNQDCIEQIKCMSAQENVEKILLSPCFQKWLGA